MKCSFSFFCEFSIPTFYFRSGDFFFGCPADIKVDVRIITATNQDLEAHVREKNFREDLYYRIKVAEIKLPPLRERGDDAELLIEHFLRAAFVAIPQINEI